MTEDDYPEGAAKRDPDSGMLAQRSMFAGEKAWWVFRLDARPHLVAHKDIEHWEDITL